jgi:uncharacterized membrane protein (UPF0136 family)
MNFATFTAIGYGILAGIGGILGYTKAGSQISLVSGLVSGLLLIVGGIAHQQSLSWGLPLSVIVTVGLIITFGIRFAKTRKFMPAGLMVIAGILALLGLTA